MSNDYTNPNTNPSTLTMLRPTLTNRESLTMLIKKFCTRFEA